MFEERKEPNKHSYALKLFPDLPWTVRAFFSLFIIVLVALLIFGFAGHASGIPAFSDVTHALTELLKVVGGAVVGALSNEGAKKLKRKDS